MRAITPELKLLLACCRLATAHEEQSRKQVELECLPVIRDLPVSWQEFIQLATYHNVLQMVHEIFTLPSMQRLMPKSIQQTLQQQLHQLEQEGRAAEQFDHEYIRALEQTVPSTHHRSGHQRQHKLTHRPAITTDIGSVAHTHRIHSQFEGTVTDGEYLLAICVYGATHRWQRLKLLCDIATLLKQPHTIDWSAWMELMIAQQQELHVVEGIVLANALLAAPIPADIYHSIDQADIMPLISKTVHAMLAGPKEQTLHDTANHAKARNPFNRFVLRRSWLQHS